MASSRNTCGSGLSDIAIVRINARVADELVTVFGQLFAADFPIERMRIAGLAELNAPPTGDGNTTEVFACRQARGQTA